MNLLIRKRVILWIFFMMAVAHNAGAYDMEQNESRFDCIGYEYDDALSYGQTCGSENINRSQS